MSRLIDITDELSERDALVCDQCYHVFTTDGIDWKEVSSPCPNCGKGGLFWIV